MKRLLLLVNVPIVASGMVWCMSTPLPAAAVEPIVVDRVAPGVKDSTASLNGITKPVWYCKILRACR